MLIQKCILLQSCFTENARFLH